MGRKSEAALLLVLSLALCCCVTLVSSCVLSCHCTIMGTGRRHRGRKVDCSRHPGPLDTFKSIAFPADTVHLDLSQNSITSIETKSFFDLSKLQKLNLSHNNISNVESGAFQGLRNLKRLDLSNNLIQTINGNMFTGLPNLERLFFSNNRIITISEGTFNDLKNLKKLDFSSKLLHCDCNLKWILKWAKTKHVRIYASTVCAFPKEMKNRPLTKLRKKDLHCNHKYQPPVFHIQPSTNQLVFVGDKLPFECRASLNPGMDISWLREGQKVKSDKLRGVHVFHEKNPSGNMVNLHLVVEKLELKHQGDWTCMISSPTGNLSKKVHVQVRTLDDVRLCPAVIENTAKGVFRWDQAMAGLSVTQPCPAGRPGAVASQSCGLDGRWMALDTSNCSFVHETTRILFKLATELRNSDAYIEGVKKVLRLSKENNEPLMALDVYFLAQIMHSRLQLFVKANPKVIDVLVDIASNVSNVPLQEIYTAQRNTNSANKIVKTLEEFESRKAPMATRSWLSANVAVEQMSIETVLDFGVNCWLQEDLPSQEFIKIDCSKLKPENGNVVFTLTFPSVASKDKNLTAVNGNATSEQTLDTNDTTTKGNAELTGLSQDDLIALNASFGQLSLLSHSLNITNIQQPSYDVISLPLGMATTVHPLSVHEVASDYIRLVAFRNGNLFPTNWHTDPLFLSGNWSVVTPVVLFTLPDENQGDFKDAVAKFFIPDTRRPLALAFFDFGASNGLGAWKTDGLRIVEQKENYLMFGIDHSAYYAVLQDMSVELRQAAFPMEPVLYVGSGVCFLCLMFVIITYICCFGSIGVPKKIKHSMVNLAISTCLLLLVFSLGINRTDQELVCQIVGISIHYLTLCAIFWITITANIMYKKFIKVNQPREPPAELGAMPLPPKPILQFYLVGYGVPIIICGITAAVNRTFYAGMQYCFLEWEPSLGAFYAPVGLLVVWNFILFLRISCIVKSHFDVDSTTNTEEDDNEIHNNEIELIPSHADTLTSPLTVYKHENGYRGRQNGANSDDEDCDDQASVHSLPDQERRPVTQLRSLVAILFLFIMMWTCAALAIAKPLDKLIPKSYLWLANLITCYLYGVMALVFGVFMLVFMCLTRRDARLSWKQACSRKSVEVYEKPSHAIEATTEIQPAQTANGSVAGKSNSNTNLSAYSQKSSNITKAHNMKNNSSKQSNINLILPDSSQVSLCSGQDNYPNFYNPKQNGAAKKFWEKNRHGKVMNKDINRELNSSMERVSDKDRSRLSRGSSDVNAHLSIEIQFQDQQSGSRDIPVHIGNNVLKGSSCGAVSLEYSAPVVQSGTPDIGNKDNNCDFQEEQIFENQPASSADKLINHDQQNCVNPNSSDHLSAFTPVHPSLPENGIQCLETKVLGNSDRRNFHSDQTKDNTETTEDIRHKENPGLMWTPFHCNLPPLPSQPHGYSQYPQHFTPGHFISTHGHLNHHSYNLNSLPTPNELYGKPLSTQMNHNYDLPPRSPAGSNSSHSTHHKRSNNWRPLSGGDSSDSSRLSRRKRSPQSKSQRIQSPMMSDSQGYSHYPSNYPASQSVILAPHKPHSVDSDHHSDPTHRKRRSRQHAANKLLKQRSVGWTEQFRNKPPKVSYAYVNHMYRDKIMHKLIKQASESDELASKAFWLPRSASEYEKLTQRGFCNMADDSSSTSDEDDCSIENVWILQKPTYNKKETSV